MIMKIMVESGFLLLAASGGIGFYQTEKASDFLLLLGGGLLAAVQLPALFP
jgi:hypothetical protein